MARNSASVVYSRIEETPIVPLFFHKDVNVAKNVLKACYVGGFACLNSRIGGRKRRPFLPN